MATKIIRTALAATFAAGMLLAQAPAPGTGPGRHGPWQGRQQRMERMATFLNLTPDQREKAKAIMTDAKQSATPVVAQLKQGHEALAAAVKASKSDADIDRLAASQGVLMGQLTAIRTKALEKFYSLLTPEQQQKADQMHQRMKDMFERHRGTQG